MFTFLNLKTSHLLYIIWVVSVLGFTIILLNFFSLKKGNKIVDTMQDYITNNLTTNSSSQFIDIFKQIEKINITNFSIDKNLAIYHYWNTIHYYLKKKQIQDDVLEQLLWYWNTHKLVLFSNQPTSIEEYPWVQDMLFYSDWWIFAGIGSTTKLLFSQLPLEVSWKLVSWFWIWPFMEEDLKELKDMFINWIPVKIGNSWNKYMLMFKIWDEQYKPLNVLKVKLNEIENQEEQWISAIIPSTYENDLQWVYINLENAWKKIWQPIKDLSLHTQQHYEPIPNWLRSFTLLMKVVKQDTIEYELQYNGLECDPWFENDWDWCDEPLGHAE